MRLETERKTTDYIQEQLELEMPAVFVWDHKNETMDSSGKYSYYLMSKLDQKSVIIDGIGSKCVHYEDEEKYKKLIVSESNGHANLRMLNVHEEYVPVQIKKEIIRDDNNEKIYTIVTIKTIYLEQKNAAVEDLSTSWSSQDRLTGLLSKEAFESICIKERNINRERHVNVIGIICIDQYCLLKKKYSIGAMDKVITEVADLIKCRMNKDMILSRYWEDSFLLCYHDAPSLDAAYDFFKTLSDNVRLSVGDSETITISIGISRCRHNRDMGYLKAFNMAREGLLDAHRKGGAQTTFLSDSFEEGRHIIVNLPPSKDIYIRMFGNFDVFINGKPVLFRNKKSKELLALLVTHRGGLVSAEEVIASLWENEPVNKTTLSRYRKVAMRLNRTLEEYGIEDIVFTENRHRRVDTSKFKCDYIEYISGKTDRNLPVDTFLKQYSWSEEFRASLYEEKLY